MRARKYLVAAALPVLFVTPALAGGPVSTFYGLAAGCSGFLATVTQCAYQDVKGNHNIAVTKQETVHFGKKHSVQLAITLQDGNGNKAYTGQNGSNQVAVTIQSGDNNGAFTYQQGHNQAAAIVEVGNGQWAAISNIGDNTATAVVLYND
jgi:hypothetical protein